MEELSEIEREIHKKIEEIYGKDVLDKFKSIIEDGQGEQEEIEMLKLFMRDSIANLGIDLHLDEHQQRLYLYPDGVDNQRELILLEYNNHSKLIYVSGHGENTNIDYVCNPTRNEVVHCLVVVIDQFRKDNDWTWKMPCETRGEGSGDIMNSDDLRDDDRIHIDVKKKILTIDCITTYSAVNSYLLEKWHGDKDSNGIICCTTMIPATYSSEEFNRASWFLDDWTINGMDNIIEHGGF